MVPISDADIAGKIRRATFQGASMEEMRPLYIERNAFELALDAPVYRIIELQYFLEDWSKKRLTYSKIDKIIWKDSSENLLLFQKFKDEITDGQFPLFNEIVSRFYGSCWSATAFDTTSDNWAIFSRNNPAVRVQSTPRKLLDTTMSKKNKFYMLQHFIGKMRYAADVDIKEYFSDPNWEKYLDSNGQGIATSFLLLSENLSHENEVRLIYDHLGEWSNDNVWVTADRCFAKVPFNWPAVIDDLVVGPLVSDGEKIMICKELKEFGINCTVSSSSTRTNIGYPV